jgi:L-serine dehydratase
VSLSVLDFFAIGIGPSSSHTVGPMRAARRFIKQLSDAGTLDRTARVVVQLFGSLALTGKGHGTDKAVILGLEGDAPETVDVDSIPARLDRIASEGTLRLGGWHGIAFDKRVDLEFRRTETLPGHSNALRIRAWDARGAELASQVFYSTGGGFIRPELEANHLAVHDPRPYPFRSAADLLRFAQERGLSVSGLMLANETAIRPETETRAALLRVWAAMRDCIERGCGREGVLPGGLHVARRAARLCRELNSRNAGRDPLTAMDWVGAWAMAVNEENAVGGRVVTAPTNGAAGILPAVLRYLEAYHRIDEDGVMRFLLTAGALAMLYKMNASISGAEVGCQGEVGVAASMAAGALAEAMGGTVLQVENAAEIAMEHHLGLTCDPIGGLVQVPCIERNAVGAVKAIQAARLALHGDGTHRVSLDKAIATMRETGADMSTKYKETARGGLALNLVEC